MGSQPVFDVVYHHSVRAQPGEVETTPATETMTVRLGDLTNTLQYPWFTEMSDSLIILRVSHRYLQIKESPKKYSNPLTEIGPDGIEKAAQGFSFASTSIADQNGNWSSALFDLIRLDPEPTLISEDTKRDENAFVDLNQFCYFCQQLCKTSRAFNTYVHEEDAAMPRQEPSDRLGKFDRQLPNRQILEYFDFWPSSEGMLSSARNGCHLCTIICYRLIERLHCYPEFGCVEYDLESSLSSSLGGLHDNHDSPGCVEVVPSSDPLKLVVCWAWWLPNRHVARTLYMAWPLKGHFNNPYQGSCFLRSQCYVDLGCSVDATSAKGTILFGTQPDPYHPEFPKFGDGKDYLFSHYTGSDSWLKLADGWIHACHREHSCHRSCAEPEMPFRPTRLLDVGDSNGLQIPRLNIKQSNSGRVQYLALSHCWGQNSNNLYSLTEETEEELLQGVQVEKLSRTFQDAVKVCRKLNQRYIWIDSLCIKQDNPDDWIQEAAQMHLVYAKSYCTIAAVCAKGSEEGFLRWRNPRGKPRLPISSFLLRVSN